MAAADNVMSLLREKGPLMDAQIASALRLRHQQVNQVCRRLVDGRRVIRSQGPQGSLINRVPGQAVPPAPEVPMTEGPPGVLTEDEIKRAVKDHLQKKRLQGSGDVGPEPRHRHRR